MHAVDTKPAVQQRTEGIVRLVKVIHRGRLSGQPAAQCKEVAAAVLIMGAGEHLACGSAYPGSELVHAGRSRK